MDLKEMFAKMNSGSVQAHSELGTRDEAKQTRSFGARIQKMKTVTGINARVLVMKDVVLKFNPFTCEPDDNYNDKTPFRPILLVSQTLQGIVDFCKENPEINKKWKKKISVDMTDPECDLETVYLAFKTRDYIKPRVMTYHTVTMNFGGHQGFPQFKSKYMVDPAGLNDQYSYDYGPSAPLWHQAAVFFNSMLKPEADEKKSVLERQGANKDQIQKERSAVYAKSPVGFVAPTNLVPFFYFPFSADLKNYDPSNPKEVEADMRFYSYVDKWTVPLKEAAENPMYDSDIDFYDFTIKTPSSKDTKSNGTVYTDEDSMELYTAMQITNTDGRVALHGGKTRVGTSDIPNEELFAGFIETAKAYFMYSQEQSGAEGGDTFEKVMALSNRFRKIETVLDNFLPACNEVFAQSFANSKYFTEEIRNQNSVFFVAMNPANAKALAALDEEDLEEAAERGKTGVADLIAEAREDSTIPDLGALEFSEG